MDFYLPRSEIRRLMNSYIGRATSDVLAAQVREQNNDFIDLAAVKAHGDCRWVASQRRVTVQLGAAQNTLNYPANCGPGGIIAMAVWDTVAQKYYKLTNRTIPVEFDQDNEAAAGGDEFTNVQNRPKYFEQQQQIALWPYSDQIYQVRIHHQVTAKFTTGDTQISIVDGQLIAYWATAMAFKNLEDESQASHWQTMYVDRLQQLRGEQNSGEVIPGASDANMDEDEDWYSYLPNWNPQPTVR